MRDYHINIFYSEEDEGYIADIPDLDACSAFGKTPDAVLGQLQIARKDAVGKPQRRPTKRHSTFGRYRPAIYHAAWSLDKQFAALGQFIRHNHQPGGPRSARMMSSSDLSPASPRYSRYNASYCFLATKSGRYTTSSLSGAIA